MIDILLHVAFTLVVMSVCLLNSTPWPVSWVLALGLAVFWFAREIAQDVQKHGTTTSWSLQKCWEAIAPAITGFVCAGGITVWRLNT